MSPRCDHARLLASEPRAMQIRIMHASMIPASTRLAAILLLANLFVTGWPTPQLMAADSVHTDDSATVSGAAVHRNVRGQGSRCTQR